MTTPAEHHVVLGATGGTGSAVVRELLARGLSVRAVTRGTGGEAPAGVERVLSTRTLRRLLGHRASESYSSRHAAATTMAASPASSQKGVALLTSADSVSRARVA